MEKYKLGGDIMHENKIALFEEKLGGMRNGILV